MSGFFYFVGGGPFKLFKGLRVLKPDTSLPVIVILNLKNL
jgi:hypothetical protein